MVGAYLGALRLSQWEARQPRPRLWFILIWGVAGALLLWAAGLAYIIATGKPLPG